MKLHLRDNYYAVIDDEDYQRMVEYFENKKADPARWSLTYSMDTKVNYYAVKRIGGRQGKLWSLHRFIFHLRGIDLTDIEVDHRDGDGLNNQFSNLRIVTSSQNKTSRGVRSDSKSGYKGVEFQRQNNNWCAYICYGGKKRHLGVYLTAEKAALAYNGAAIKQWGEYAWTNRVKRPKLESWTGK